MMRTACLTSGVCKPCAISFQALGGGSKKRARSCVVRLNALSHSSGSVVSQLAMMMSPVISSGVQSSEEFTCWRRSTTLEMVLTYF